MTRLFMIAVLLLATSYAETGPIVSNVGSKALSFMQDGKQDAIPYVTKGLLYMWDGEWNAGIKKHVDSASVWKDIVEGNEIAFTSVHSFEENRLVTIPGKFGKGTIRDLKDKPWTIECIYRSYSKNVNAFCAISIGYWGAAAGAYYIPLYSRFVVCSLMEYFYGYLDNTDVHVAQGVCNVTAATRYLDGICISKDVKLNKQYNPTTTVLTGCREEGVSLAGNGEIYCIRIYNRCLDEEELMHNYMIDKERFGL